MGHFFSTAQTLPPRPTSWEVGSSMESPEQGDIVGREYIISSKFMPPYGILLAESTIELCKVG
jgi:hypothetical protein